MEASNSSSEKHGTTFLWFGQANLQKISAQHLADCLLLPDQVSQSFSSGGFSFSITGKPWHSVGLDEAHEMLINKDCKSAVIHPTKEFIKRMALYFPFHAKVLKNLQKQLSTLEPCSLIAVSAAAVKFCKNTWAMKDQIESSKLLPLPTDQQLQLRNSFTGTTASLQQQEDLLNFRRVGEEDFYNFVEYTYLKISSVRPRTKRHNLKTFTKAKVVKKSMVNQLQREKSLVTKCLKSRLLLAQMQEGDVRENPTNEQFIELPKAIADENGLPNKGQKCNTTTFFVNRYSDQVFLQTFPLGWIPDCVVMEGMFLIQTTPLRIHSNMWEYSRFIAIRHVGWYIKAGVAQIHIVFDDEGRLEPHPKFVEGMQSTNPLHMSTSLLLTK